MRRQVLAAAIVAAAAGVVPAPGAPSGAGDETGVRRAALAGKFYPANADTLRRAVTLLVDRARPAVASDVVAVIAPHAGYVFSGQIAADALRHLAVVQPDVVVVLGANHTAPTVRGVALHPGRAFRTPLGEIPVDRDVTAALLAAGVGAKADAAPHKDEHSIEVVLPFVQVLAPRATVVPAIVGGQSANDIARFGRALAAVLAGKRALIVASSDLSHYPTAREAAVADRQTLEQIARFDSEGLVTREYRTSQVQPSALVTLACGLGPVLAAMSAAQALGARHATVTSYANSADVPVGDEKRVVGYGAVVFHRDEPTAAGAVETDGRDVGTEVPPGALDAGGRQALMALARATITQYLQSETLPLLRDLPPALVSRRHGVFVTIKQRGELRGCIGTVLPEGPLPHLVSRAAFGAAFRDSRFTPLARGEAERIDIEISVLGPVREVSSLRDIVVGRDGVVLKKSGKTALFLPQIAIEAGWTRERMLDELCAKAQLRERCWMDRATLSTFQAEVFSEHDVR